MILPDVNILVYAFRPSTPRHEEHGRWLTALVDGPDELALHEVVVAGLVRVVTNPRIFPRPAPTAAALEFVMWLRDAPGARWIPSGPATWNVFDRLVAEDPGIRGNLVPDAHLAATVIAHGARLATTDRGFARYPGLRFFDPASPT